MITSIRNWCYDLGILKSTAFDIPIISVGNLAVGGSGKTPMVEYLIRELKQDYKIATLSRGYGRDTKGFLWVENYLLPSQTGDEPLQIKRKFNNIAVAVCEDRVAGVNQILKDKPETNLILLDDAFQHRAIKPSVQLLLSTCAKPFYRDWLMPSGRLRESRSGAKRADAIIYTKCEGKLLPSTWQDKKTFYSEISYPSSGVEGPVFGFSALADNSVFQSYLESTSDLVGFRNFADHHSFTKADIESLKAVSKDATLVCTEKDSVKLASLDTNLKFRYISIETTISEVQKFNTWLKTKLNES